MRILDLPKTNSLFIDQVWMVVSVDDEGHEGVCAAPLLGPGSMIPLIAADKARLDGIMHWAKELAKISTKKIKLIKLTTREEIEEITA